MPPSPYMASYARDDPDAGRLLAPASTTRKRHQVRIQGRLVHVRSVSTVHLAPTTTHTTSSTDLPRRPVSTYDVGVGQTIRRSKNQTDVRRASRQSAVFTRHGPADATGLTWGGCDCGCHAAGAVDTASETDEDEQATALRDRQRRGYGIGGAGNIRRPTEVVQFYAFSRGGTGQDRGRRRWQWMSSLFGWRGRKDNGNDGQINHGGDSRVDTDAVRAERRP